MTGLEELIEVLEFNSHHDARGRFASGGGGGSAGGSAPSGRPRGGAIGSTETPDGLFKKHPWQMTKDEWMSAHSPDRTNKINSTKGPTATAIEIGRLGYGIRDTWVSAKKGQRGRFDQEGKYKAMISKAISVGEKVPPKIRAAYFGSAPKP